VAGLVTAAERHDATMIVVGTRGEGITPALSRLIRLSMLHSVVIHRQYLPVLIVPSLPGDEA
jgi:hypothetical protein